MTGGDTDQAGVVQGYWQDSGHVWRGQEGSIMQQGPWQSLKME